MTPYRFICIFLFTRLKCNTSEASLFDQPTKNHQHELIDKNSIDKIKRHDITSNHKGDIPADSGLDWFHSIIPSLNMTSPIITSTQKHLHRRPNSSWSEMSTVNKQPNCQAEKEVLSNTASSLNSDVVSNTVGTVTLASEEDRKGEKNEEDKKHLESSGCVIQNVSKKLRDRRLRGLELKHQQCDKEGAGGHGERVVFRDTTFVTNVLDTTSDSHTSCTLSSGKNCPSNNQVLDSLSSVKESGFEEDGRRECTGTKNISTVQREKIVAKAETGKGLHDRLSGFIFQPRKIRSLSHNQGLKASSDMSATECNPGCRDLHTNKESRISNQKAVSHNESDGTRKATEKDRSKKKQNQIQNLSEAGGMRKRVNTGMETKVESHNCTPPSKPVTSKSCLTKSAVASSTLAKLSVFSFTCTTEPKTISPPPDTELSPGREREPRTESPTKTKSKCSAKPARAANHSNSVKMVTDGPVDYQSTDNMKKRKCFELSPQASNAGGSQGRFSKLSIFGSVESNDDVLDTDWDQEVLKKAKV